jgi:nucleotide-binding universal stress UspA family protein
MTGTAPMFGKLLHANDGSEHAFDALSMAFAIAKENPSELNMVCVEEIDNMPEFIEEVREGAGHSARYEWLVGSRADRIVQLAHCPVLVTK